MKDIASWALETAKLRGASHAEARIVDERGRSLATKNGRIAGASDSESMGIGIRVIANGGFGFAATDDLSREGVEGREPPWPRGRLPPPRAGRSSSSARRTPGHGASR